METKMNTIARSVLLAIYIVVSTSAFAQNASTQKTLQPLYNMEQVAMWHRMALDVAFQRSLFVMSNRKPGTPGTTCSTSA